MTGANGSGPRRRPWRRDGCLRVRDAAGPGVAKGDHEQGTAAAADVVGSVEVDATPWANELAADSGGAWAWSDTGVVLRVAAATDTFTRIDLGSAADGGPNTLGSRGVALAWSQVWASDPGHRGLARIDRETESVVQRIELWSADDLASSGSAPTGDATPDRWASASGFAIDGDSIFVPSIAARPGDVVAPPGGNGELWRADTASGRPPDWISLDRPTGVAVGFGSVWVVSCCGAHSDARTYTIVRLERETGGVQASITLPVPEAGADGRPVVRIGSDSVWVGLADLPLVVRIDPATSSIRSTLPTELPVSDIAVGSDGSLWIAESETWYRYGAVMSDRCEGRLVRVDPVLERPVGLDHGHLPDVGGRARQRRLGGDGGYGAAIDRIRAAPADAPAGDRPARLAGRGCRSCRDPALEAPEVGRPPAVDRSSRSRESGGRAVSEASRPRCS